MRHQRPRRRPDPFALLLIAVAIGMAATLAYQVRVYYGAAQVPIARQESNPPGFGG